MTLTCHALSVSAGDAVLLHPLDLALPAGELIAIVGPNGAGKSTLMAALAGESSAAGAAAVHLEGRALPDWAPEALARRRAWVPQRPELAFGVPAWQLVSLGRLPWRDPDPLPAVERALATLDLGALAHRDVATLSGGEATRVHVARALAQLDQGEGPGGWLLLDEPTAALDLRHREALLSELRGLTHAGLGVLTILHDLGEALRHADRVVLIQAGRLVAEGPPGEVLTEARIAEVWGLPVRVLDGPDGAPSAVVPAFRSAPGAAKRGP